MGKARDTFCGRLKSVGVMYTHVYADVSVHTRRYV